MAVWPLIHRSPSTRSLNSIPVNLVSLSSFVSKTSGSAASKPTVVNEPKVTPKPQEKPIIKESVQPKVSIPDPVKIAETVKPKPDIKKVEEVKPDSVPLVSTEPTKPKTSLKKKTYKTENVVDNVLERVAEKAKQDEAKHMAGVFKRLEQSVENDISNNHGQMQGGGGGVGEASLGAFDIYNLELKYHINKYWAFSELLAQEGRDMETKLNARILADGTITNLHFLIKSGNAYLDDSAYRAVQKANPVPRLPDGFPYYEVTLTFSPRGLR
ncbi:MAG: TonB family protein [Desulfobacterales bacterium]|nr:TonB family protein [Desulfobacterales bacterium]